MGRPVGTKLNGRIRFLSDSEIKMLVRTARRKRKYELIVSMALYFGLRSKEIVSLKLTDIDHDNRIITIHPVKGGIHRN